MKQLYLAAPFFNKWELAKVAELEKVFDATNVPFFSPRSLGPDRVSDLQDRVVRRYINARNLENIRMSEILLAWVDRILPPGQEVCIVQFDKDAPVMRRKGLIKPDDGTLWEMGYASGLGIPVVVYTERNPTEMNIMMIENCAGMLCGTDDLRNFCETSQMRGQWAMHMLTGYSGGYR